MQLFECPFCGPRDQTEFTYLREIAPVPALDADRDAWLRFVYQRDNPCGAHGEWWHHTHGCREVLELLRDTRTHELLQARLARQPVAP